MGDKMINKKSVKLNCVFVGALLTSFVSVATAEITVDKSQGQLSIISDNSGLVIVKVIGPDDVIVVDERYLGNTFNWAPSTGLDGAYRYDVRIIEESNLENDKSGLNEYAGGSIEVVNGVIPFTEGDSIEEKVE